MTRFLFLAFLILVCEKIIAQQSVATKAVDELLLKESSFNFGKIAQGRPVTHVFEIVNVSKDTLNLENVQASCGCTTPEWDHSSILPGKTREIKVGYNALAEGGFEKNISIFYNKGQLKTLVIRGEVWHTPEQSAPKNNSIALLKTIN
jgi:hypothetical protein